MSFSSKIKVAVLRGGPSDEYDVSLKTGGHVLSILRQMPDKYDPQDILISRDGEWHLSGLVDDPHKVLQHVDVVWNALHGQYGEDGQVQRVLEGLQIPFTGSGAVASALSMNKDMAKGLYKSYGLLTPEHELIDDENLDEDKLIAIFQNYLHPVIVKPASSGSSVGMHLARSFSELKEAVKEAFKYSKKVLVEEFVKGNEATCVVLEGARGEKIYAFVPVNKSEANHRSETNRQIEKMAREAHNILGLRHYSSSDFIITPKDKVYILETDSLPVFHEGSLAHKSVSDTGWHHRDFVDHVIKLAM